MKFTSAKRVVSLVRTYFESLRTAGHCRKYVVGVHCAQDQVGAVPFLAAETVWQEMAKEESGLDGLDRVVTIKRQ